MVWDAQVKSIINRDSLPLSILAENPRPVVDAKSAWWLPQPDDGGGLANYRPMIAVAASLTCSTEGELMLARIKRRHPSTVITGVHAKPGRALTMPIIQAKSSSRSCMKPLTAAGYWLRIAADTVSRW